MWAPLSALAHPPQLAAVAKETHASPHVAGALGGQIAIPSAVSSPDASAGIMASAGSVPSIVASSRPPLSEVEAEASTQGPPHSPGGETWPELRPHAAKLSVAAAAPVDAMSHPTSARMLAS